MEILGTSWLEPPNWIVRATTSQLSCRADNPRYYFVCKPYLSWNVNQCLGNNNYSLSTELYWYIPSPSQNIYYVKPICLQAIVYMFVEGTTLLAEKQLWWNFHISKKITIIHTHNVSCWAWTSREISTKAEVRCNQLVFKRNMNGIFQTVRGVPKFELSGMHCIYMQWTNGIHKRA